ncbi:MAG: hypothetical protein ACRECT_00990 [Thermoplasmata archaeon]
MASPFYRPPLKPPGLYRAARALRRVSALVLVLLVLYVGFVAYSAVQVAETAPRVGSPSVTYEANDTVGITTSISLSDPSLLSIQHFELAVRLLNSTGSLLVASEAGPTNVARGSGAVLPVQLYVPVSGGGESLLTENQYLDWDVWGNASYGYLFTVSVGIDSEREWGAPLDDLQLQVGAPGMTNGTTEIPVTLSFTDDASFSDDGAVSYQVVAPSGTQCGEGSFTLDVPPSTPYSDTEALALPPGCNPSGGHVNSEFVGNGFRFPLPPEPIP